MHRVLVVCRDTGCIVSLKLSLHLPDFELSVTGENGIAAAKLAIELLPSLIVLEMDTAGRNLGIAEAVKLFLPDLPIFLVMSLPTAQSEKAALSRGIDAVFEKSDDYDSLLLNAIATLECEPC